MIEIDMRFDQSILNSFVGQLFNHYKCDSFDYTNSVTQVVGLFIGKEAYKITNIQETVDYYGIKEDVAISKITSSNEKEIKSAFRNRQLITNPINEQIDKIILINEHQTLRNDKDLSYNVWLTRALIFEAGGRQIMFEKDYVPFSEEIIIYKGYDLEKKLPSCKEFLKGWPDNYIPQCQREMIILK